MPRPILYMFQGDHYWMLSQGMPEDEGGTSPPATATPLPRDVDIEAALRKLQAEIPDYEIRIASWHRPKRDA